MEVEFVANEDDKDKILFYFLNIVPGYNTWMQTLLHKREDGSWVNMHSM